MEKIDQLDLAGSHLALFLSVYDNNSVSKAAAQLGLNQSTVSYGLDRLRNALGDPLFVKSGRGIVPTDRAIILAPSIRMLVERFGDLTEAKDYLPAEDGREISIAANVMELLPMLKLVHADLVAQAPNSPVKFLELGSRHNTKELLDQNIADVVISVRLSTLPNSLNSRIIYRDEIVCFYDAAMRGPIETIEEFAAAEHATLDFGGTAKSTIDLLLEQDALERTIKLRAPNAFALGDLMRGTTAITSMQKALKYSALNGLVHSPHPLKVPEAVFEMVWHKKHNNSPRNSWLRETIVRNFDASVSNHLEAAE